MHLFTNYYHDYYHIMLITHSKHYVIQLLAYVYTQYGVQGMVDILV